MVDLPAEFTVAWLGEALVDARHANQWGQLTSVTSEPIGTGQMGENLRLRLGWDGDGPATMVAKLPASDPLSRATGVERGAYEREVAFYQNIASTVEVRTPECHFAASINGGSDFVLIMEDLAPATQGNQLKAGTIDQAEAVLIEAAGLHGPRWGDPALTQYRFLSPHTQQSVAHHASIYRHFLPVFVERHRHDIDPQVLEVASRFGPRYESWALSYTGPLTFVHGDLRLDNIMFMPGRRPAVVDWQTLGTGTGIRDVSYYLSAGLSHEDRRSSEAQLLETYHQQLQTYGVNHLSRNEVWLEYRAQSFAGLIMAVIATGLVEQTERGDEMFRVMASGAATQVIDLESEELLPPDGS